MCKILFLTNVIRRMGMMNRTLEALQSEGLLSHVCACRWLDASTVWTEAWRQELKNTDFFYLKWMGTGMDTPFLRICLSLVRKRGIPYYIDASGSKEGELAGGFCEAAYAKIKSYSTLGGEKNYRNLWLYLHFLLTGTPQEVAEPDPVYWCGIYHPRADRVYTDLAAYWKNFCTEGRITVGMLFYREEWVWGDLTYQQELVEAVEGQGMNMVCVFTNGIPSEEMGMPSLRQICETFFSRDGQPVIDVLINVMKFSITASGSVTTDYFRHWGVPLLEAYTLIAPYEQWRDSLEGMDAMEVSISAALPEFDGAVHGVPIACKKILPNGDIRYLPIRERVKRMAAKAKKIAALRKKPRADKRVAIIFHNYPPKNANIGSALGLDSIESVRRLLKLMRDHGYHIDRLPEDSGSFSKQLTAKATNDLEFLTERQLKEACKIAGSTYKSFLACQPKSAQQQMLKDWGDPPGKVMEFEGQLLLPGSVSGNVFITVQPPRGFGEDPTKIYHDPFLAPTHHYLAFYYWLRQVWRADAVLHVGTHGSLEWLPGKNAGLSSACFPDLALGDLPDIYPYNMTITGEGIQAKRRGAACLIGHLPAPQSRAGLYDELAELEKILEEYAHFTKNQPENLPRLEELVKAKVREAKLEEEVLFEENRPFSDYVLRLHNYIEELKNLEVHTGLHILGEYPAGEELTDYIWLLTRLPNGAIPALPQVVAESYGLSLQALAENSCSLYAPLNLTYAALNDRIYSECRELIDFLRLRDFSQEALGELRELPQLKRFKPETVTRLMSVCGYICGRLYGAIKKTRNELTHILASLDGNYILPGPSGAPSSGGADLLPSGCNFYGVDPRTLPTPAAWAIGCTLAEQVIERFIAEEGRYPENIGIVLWSGSNMRSHGQCIAEILYLLGVRPVYQAGSLRVKGLEVIPLDELKRPRIDVTARISGLFRDTLPNLCALLDDAVLLAASLVEEPYELNYVRKHIEQDAAELEKQGLEQEAARRQASFRVYGDAQGTYGAGVAALLESRNWESLADIAEVYIRWGAHAYGGTAKGQYLPESFRRRMGSLDITIKNEDNHEINMLSSDDYNAYHGGMIAAVRSIRGSAPKSYCGDSTDRSRIALHSVQEEAVRIFRSEAVNPKFIQGMMKHGYKGASDLANMVAHSFQWDATSGVMQDWMYEKYAEKYALAPKVQQWLREVNPWALKRMTETLLEAQRRGLWQAQEKTKSLLEGLYLDMEGELEEQSDDC